MYKDIIDGITQIHNEEYLKENYRNYIDNNPNCNFIMIDFENFKNINDTFGHNTGDVYLKFFAKVLKKYFKDSIVVRLHGDEFAVLTKYNEDEINKILESCNEEISLAVKEGVIPKKFSYNAGSTKASYDMEDTKEKADTIMYHAKRNEQYYQRFSQEIFDEKIKQKMFLSQIDVALKQDSFSYNIRQLFSKGMTRKNIYQIYTRDKYGNPIFDNSRYDILKNTSKIQQFDIYNVQNLLENMVLDNKKIMIIIDYKSLLFNNDILDYFIILKDIYKFPFQNIILGIDLSDIDILSYEKVIDKIIQLKSLGFKVSLDKFDSKIGDALWENAEVDYIKFSNRYWKSGIDNSRICSSISYKMEAWHDTGIVPIFDFIENKEEYGFVSGLPTNDILLSGNYFSEEKRLVLKK